MPTPRITGLLHNCALNSGLPTILKGIQSLADRELEGTLGKLEDDHVFKTYQSLKHVFARHYGIASPENFRWESFAAFINGHSFYGNEIIFAPVLRKFIAEMAGITEGYKDANLSPLRDIQADGTYNDLHESEAAELFHKHFGITLRTYEHKGDQGTGNTQDNYNLIATRVTDHAYPFGATPTVSLYFHDDHFEIQPHEDIAEANAAYIHEIANLPQTLSTVHDDLSFSIAAYTTNRALGKLFVYVKNKLSQQLAEEDKQRRLASYVVTAGQYAISGQEYHENSYAGRQTFAVILLTLAQESSGKEQATELLQHLSSLNYAANLDAPISAYLADKLAKAIIDSRMNLSDAHLNRVIKDINAHFQVNNMMRLAEENSKASHLKMKPTPAELQFLKSAEETIRLAWAIYKAEGDPSLISLIQQTEKLVLNPSLRNVRLYDNLRQNVAGKGSWGSIIAGCMLTVIGLALIVGTALAFASTFGITLPLTVKAIAAGATAVATGVTCTVLGAGFFSAGRDKGLYKQMTETLEDADVYAHTKLVH
jgi:hypothetical protein